MQAAVSLAGAIHEVLVERTNDSLDRTLFGMWWDNLTPHGQMLFHRLIAQSAPLREGQALAVLGDRWPEWVEVLETTGVARRTGGEIVPRGDLFRRWFEVNIGTEIPATSEVCVSSLWSRIDAPPFERKVIEAVSRWAEHIRETAGYYFGQIHLCAVAAFVRYRTLRVRTSYGAKHALPKRCQNVAKIRVEPGRAGPTWGAPNPATTPVYLG
jgi:hypothetical protein